MSITIDTSIVISVITNESHKKNIIKMTKAEELIAPYSLHWELANAFSAMFKRNSITLEQAKKAFDFYKEIRLRLVDIEVEKALDIAYKNNIYAYDSYFITCAKQYKSKLITLDKNLFRIAKKYNIEVIEV